MHVRHAHLALGLPILPVLQAHVGAARDQRRQIARRVRSAGTAAEHHNRVVERAAIAVLVAIHAVQEVRNLLAQKQIVLGEVHLSFFVGRV